MGGRVADHHMTVCLAMSAEYGYKQDLLELEKGKQYSNPPGVPGPLRAIASPLRWQEWQLALRTHPDRAFAKYLVEGIKEGFRVGFKYSSNQCRWAGNNMGSAIEHPEIVREYLAKECAEGRVLGPFPLQAVPGVQVSRFGVIPKGKTGKWRLIVDLSSPEGASVNDGIDPCLCSLTYVTVDDAARAVVGAGRGAFLAKADVKQAYRMVPVHPEDRLLLGMVWDDSLFVDSALPFGLRSAPKIFNALADALEWLIRQEGVESIMHYLDDFFIVASSGESCEEALRKLLTVFARLNVPIATEKLEGPTRTLTFLGIEMDTVAMSMRLPMEKMTELKLLVASWVGRRFCTLKELESLVGKLQHACKVVRPGRTFLRRMFELIKGAKKGQRFLRLNSAFKSDLAWWHLFMAQ